MQKRIIPPVQQESKFSEQEWLNLEKLVEVEITSEHADYPIEFALLPGHASGWRAAEPGKQTIRLIFSHPQQLQCIRLNFEEKSSARTQEYVLRWSSDEGLSFREIVRQQWNFNQPDATYETEDHRVELPQVTVLELIITPDISSEAAFACLQQLQLA